MRFDQIFDLNLEEFSAKKLTLPAMPPRYIAMDVTDVLWDSAVDRIEHKILPFARTELLEIPIKKGRILCQGDDIKKVAEIVFDLKEHEIDFSPGDTIGIQPANNDPDVNFLHDALGLAPVADAKLHLSIMTTTQKKAAKLPNYIPDATTCRNILKHYLNIYSIPKKLFLRSLVEFTDTDRERLFLQALCSKEGATIYSKCITDKGLTFLNLLKLCPSCKPPLEVLMEHLPRLLPRPYSVANSSLKDSSEIKVIFSIRIEDNEKGLTTGALENLIDQFSADKNNSCSVNLYAREGNNFRYTQDDLERNVIMIGIGCGIAPFLGFVEHKSELERQSARPLRRDFKTWLFAGSRYRYNAICRKQIYEFLEAGVIDEYFESYSREDDYEFKYVQDHIVANAERFVNLLLRPDTKLYVCADGSEISRKIEACILGCVEAVCNVSNDESKDILKAMRTNCRYIEDIWM